MLKFNRNSYSFGSFHTRLLSAENTRIFRNSAVKRLDTAPPILPIVNVLSCPCWIWSESNTFFDYSQKVTKFAFTSAVCSASCEGEKRGICDFDGFVWTSNFELLLSSVWLISSGFSIASDLIIILAHLESKISGLAFGSSRKIAESWFSS